ncbi:MAG: metallophosphoesterase [Peptostreptococcaceae bacterium]|nr:metallophosphoesterase [Peptostreptococcaceae bacterium]
MALYAIGDLHFSPNNSKPMDIFGWGDHRQKILQSWKEQVEEEDIVIVAGDISWAMRFEEAKENLDEINSLRGKKILLKGNHDYWWQSLTKMKKAYPDLFFLQNNCYYDDRYAIFGTRGWVVPQSAEFTEDDRRIFERELLRLQNSFASMPDDDKERIRIVAMHYPPVNEKNQASQVTELIAQNKIRHMVYGHLHGEESFKNLYLGEHDGTNYHLVSADYLDFKLKKIVE